MRSEVIKKYNEKNLPNGFTLEDWVFMQHYHIQDDDNLVGNVPEKIINYIKPLIPEYVDTIINFGCSNGKDFIPFQKNYKLVGFDLASPNGIDFVTSLDKSNFTYYQCSIQDYISDFNHSDLDLSKSLVYSSGVLMYLSKDEQFDFFNHLIRLGCKNMVFQDDIKLDGLVHTDINHLVYRELIDLFNIDYYRDIEGDSLMGYVMLDKNNSIKFDEYKKKLDKL